MSKSEPFNKKRETLKKLEYVEPVVWVEVYNVERGFASSGAFEGLGDSGGSYGDGDFT